MKPPVQLKDVFFCRVHRTNPPSEKNKHPIGKNWQKKLFDYEEIQKHNDFENYGVLAGINFLGLLDDDSENKVLHKIYQEYFPESFQIRGQIYIYLSGWDCKKRTFWDTDGKKIGELQGLGTQGLCAGSIHPSGEIYSVVKNIPIVRIQWDDFYEVFKIFIKEKQEPTLTKISEWEGDDINNIPITNIFSSDLKQCPNCGCKTGTNFKVYPETNSYFCFHSWTGGSIWEAIAINEGIKNCSSIGKNCFTDLETKEILKIAVEKYGLKQKEIIQEHKPLGWALSIDIKRLAERRGWLDCPKCNTPFQFNEKFGWFKCSCSKGGIKQFVELNHLKCLEVSK